jgi:hypothetical protein
MADRSGHRCQLKVANEIEMPTHYHSIELKLRRMYDALGTAHSKGSQELPWFVRQDGTGTTVGFDFTRDRNESQEANVMWTFIASIASLKDHLKVWCQDHSVVFGGDTLINGNRDVAIIHDLWNLDKHATLNQSRSGLWPELRHIGKGLNASAEPGQDAVSISITVNPLGIVFGGKTFVGVNALVVDKHGASLGSALDIAGRAVEAWETELVRAGVPVPPK